MLKFRLCLVLLVATMLVAPAAALRAQINVSSSGLSELAEAPSAYPKCWALLIGANYESRQEELSKDPRDSKVLVKLGNAVSDAKAFAQVLKDYYQGYDDSTVTLLTDDDPSKQDKMPSTENIRKEINRLCKDVKETDSLIVFFAGHGFKGAETSYILPSDADVKFGKPQGTNKIEVPDGLIKLVQEINSKHTLLVLDCCYSGEIFNSRQLYRFQDGQINNSGDTSLQAEKGFQALASCRSNQLASDGNLKNSPFTSALLDGLRHLPARSDSDRRVWVNRLAAYIAMQPQFNESQRPECRNLVGNEGVFCFYPREQEKFKDFMLPPDLTGQLKAMFVSRQGNWWFDEMPWFIPSIRSEIIQEYANSFPSNRSNGQKALEFEKDSLLKAMKSVLERGHQAAKRSSENAENADARYRHAKLLHDANDTQKLSDALKEIEVDLLKLCPELKSPAEATARSGNDDSSAISQADSKTSKTTEPKATDSKIAEFKAMDSKTTDTKIATSKVSDAKAAESKAVATAEDLHFLALVQHSLKREMAKTTYEKAIRAYTERAAKQSEQKADTTSLLTALCRADYGQYLTQEAEQYADAAHQFREARNSVVSFLKPREEDKNLRLEDAAAFFDIFMMCQEAEAWVEINRFTQAKKLYDQAERTCEAWAPTHYLYAHVLRKKAWANIIQWQIAKSNADFLKSNQILELNCSKPEEEDSGKPDENGEIGILQSNDYPSIIAYLHNRHGIAMGKRFGGSTENAISDYRELARDLETAYFRFKSSKTHHDLERQFIARMINTLERLGDCNLFGDPRVRDVSEAYDDYRRAQSLIHLLRGSERDQLQGLLLYKEAIALCAESPIKNVALASQMCERADSIYKKVKQNATGYWQALGELTTSYVKQCADGENSKGSHSACDLRSALLAYRDVIGASPHRDQLELCLYFAKGLVESGCARDEYQQREDTDILLSFCRTILKQSQMGASPAQEKVFAAESVPYLRPYFDSVFQSKISQKNVDVKELLQIQKEANSGHVYLKPKELMPVIATYSIEDQLWLLVDVPHQRAFCDKITDRFDVSTIMKAGNESLLPLPPQIRKTLAAWQPIGEQEKLVDVRYMPPRPKDPDPRYRATRPNFDFPFELPPEFKAAHINETSTEASTQ